MKFKALLFLLLFSTLLNAASLIDEDPDWQDTNGKPIVNGYVYIGDEGQNPVTNPKTIYSDRELTIPITNPQRTDSYGRPENKIWTDGRYSIRVDNSSNVQKYIELYNGEDEGSKTIQLTNVQGANTITAEASPTLTVLTDKIIYVFKAVSANTGAVTLQIDSTTAKDVVKYNQSALVANDILANSNVFVSYNSTLDDFVILSELPLLGAGSDGQVLESYGSGAVWGNQFEVGDIVQSMRTSKTGWLLLRGQTIGSASSGATEASADYEDLFTLLWTNCADAECAVSSGRGGSAAADWAADKTLTMPDARGRVLLGKDNMGGSSADVVTNAAADALGDVQGAQTHTLTAAEMPSHTHTQEGAGGTPTFGTGATGGLQNEASGSTGGDGAHNNMQPYLTINTFIKY